MREHHRQVLQRDVVDQLVVRALQERRVDRDHRLQPFGRKPRRERHRVLFGDGDVEIAVRESLGELDQPRAFAHRGRDADDLLDRARPCHTATGRRSASTAGPCSSP